MDLGGGGKVIQGRVLASERGILFHFSFFIVLYFILIFFLNNGSPKSKVIHLNEYPQYHPTTLPTPDFLFLQPWDRMTVS